MKQLDSLLRLEYPTTARLIRKGSLNYSAAQQAGIADSVLEQRVRRALVAVDGVSDVYFRRELLDPATPPRPYLQSYRHSTQADRSPDFFIRDCENCLITSDSTGTSHGSPYAYDTTVPILFWGSTIPAQKVDREVHTVDIAATLARLLGLEAPANLDGAVLPEITPVTHGRCRVSFVCCGEPLWRSMGSPVTTGNTGRGAIGEDHRRRFPARVGARARAITALLRVSDALRTSTTRDIRI